MQKNNNKKKSDEIDIDLILNTKVDLDDVPAYLENKVKDMISKSDTLVKEKKSVFTANTNFINYFKIPAFSISTALIIIMLFSGLLYFLNLRNDKISPKITYINGNIDISTTKADLFLDSKKMISQGEIIKTEDNSFCQINIENNTNLFIEENSHIAFEKLQKNNIKINLISGLCYFNVNKKTDEEIFQIDTMYFSARVKGTQFYIYSIPNVQSNIFVNEGEVQIIGKYKKDVTYLKSGEKFTMYDSGKNEINDINISKNDSKIFNEISSEIEKNTAKIILKTDYIDNVLTVDNKVEYEFDNFIMLTLTAGRHVVTVRNEGEIIFKENFDLKADQILKGNIEKDDRSPLISNYKKIYQFNYEKDSSKNKILGFSSNDEYVLAQTQVSVICFNKKGQFKWKRVFGDKDNIYFMSKPVIYKNKGFVFSINNKMIIIELDTGVVSKIFESPGNIPFGYQPVVFKNTLYIPFEKGIYNFNLITNKFDSESLINFKGSTTPVLYNENIYLTSFIDKSFGIYSLRDKSFKVLTIKDKSFSSALVLDDQIIIGDKSGNLYSYNKNGNLVNKTKLPAGITSNIIGDNKNIIVLSDNGILYFIDRILFTIVNEYVVDKNPRISDYIYKSPIIDKNTYFIGNNDGNILILNNKKIELNISGSSISSSLFYSEGNYFVGTSTGEVFLLD